MTTKRTETKLTPEQKKKLDQDLANLKAEYEARLAALEDWRKAKLDECLAKGYQQADLVRLTGYTRETIRRILRPEVKAAQNKRRTKKAS